MTIFFRVDAGGQYGLGHAIRCRTLAQALHAQAPDVPLVCVMMPPVLEAVAGQPGAPWSLFPCVDEWTAFEAVRAQARRGDVVVFDEPMGQSWVETLWRPKLASDIATVRIDAPWAAADSCNLLVLPGMHHSVETLEALDATFGERLLVGAEYVMLRDDLTENRRSWVEHQAGIAFNAGGSDPEQVLPLLYTMTRTLSDLLAELPPLFYLVGPLSASWELAHLSFKDFITGFSHMTVAQAGLFVNLWGATVYEALALGTPTLTIARTEAEAEDVARLEAATEGAVQSLGTLAGLMRETLCDRLVGVWQDAGERKRMHYASAGLLDGKGAERVARAVLALGGS